MVLHRQWAVGSALAAGVLGLTVSILADLPADPSVVAVSSFFMLVALTAKRLRR